MPSHDLAYEVGSFYADDRRFFVEVADGRVALLDRRRLSRQHGVRLGSAPRPQLLLPLFPDVPWIEQCQ